MGQVRIIDKETVDLAAGQYIIVDSAADGAGKLELKGLLDAKAGTATATTAAPGLMAASDKAKLDGVAPNATSDAASTAAPLMDGSATAGAEAAYARGDHRHPTDTSRAPIASPAFTGTPTAPTAEAGTDTDQLATTAFVQAAIDSISIGYLPGMLAGGSESLLGGAQLQDAFTQRATPAQADGLARIESIHGNTIVQDDALVSVNMQGITAVGFNQWDEEWEVGGISSSTGADISSTDRIRSKNYIPVIGGQRYYINNTYQVAACYASDKSYIGNVPYTSAGTNAYYLDMPSNARYMRFSATASYGTTYKGDICVNISDAARNGTYEPYTTSAREIPVSDYFPDGMRSAGSAYDELTAGKAIKRVGSVDLGTLNWSKNNIGYFAAAVSPYPKVISYNNMPNGACADYSGVSFWNMYNAYDNVADKSFSVTNGNGSNNSVYFKDTSYSDAASFKTAMSGVILYYELATPVTTEISDPLNMCYRVETGGTEAIAIPTGELSAPAPMVIAYGLTAEGLRDGAMSIVATVEGATASANYAAGRYFVHGGKLYKATTAIATGEAIVPGTNCMQTTVMAELLALTS